MVDKNLNVYLSFNFLLHKDKIDVDILTIKEYSFCINSKKGRMLIQNINKFI